ncbi:MAG: N-6 DNA methylase, partial [Pirellulales bacterium]
MAVISTPPHARNSLRRQHGRYYTPGTIAREMFDSAWLAATTGDLADRRAPLRILDPACGDGAFLLTAFDRLMEQARPRFADRLAIVRDQLFGVDIDTAAIEKLRRQLFERIAPPAKCVQTTIRAIESNIRVGNALTGPDFRQPEQPCPCSRPVDDAEHVAPLNFADAFPKVADVGGFDLVIGNPPYRRELNAKPEFARLAESPLGQRWRQARMDLWYYFLHRGLDLLRPGGWLCYIVNSYWTSSSGARRLVERLEQETTLEEVVLLGDAPIFAGVAGKHLIFRLRATRTDALCRVIDVSNPGRGQVHFPGGRLSDGRFTRRKMDLSPFIEPYHVSRDELFQHGRLVLGRPPSWTSALAGLPTLGDFFEVRQGMAENPPSINRKTAEAFPGEYQVGDGVFVLTDEERELLRLSPRETGLLRPYYRTSDILRYELPATPTRSVLHLTKFTAPSLDGLPHVAAHLERYRPILERRREVRAGKIAWWHLHWPREERIFAEPRILAVQMGRT